MNAKPILACLAAVLAGVAAAAPKGPGSAQTAHRRSPYVGAISMDAASGDVLFERGADDEAYPASVTKLMTLLLVMEDVRAGRYDYADRVVTTADVNGTCEASWIGLRRDDVITVRDLCYALMVESANDAAVMLAVHAAGSLDAFVARMNARAKELGMTRTRYCNPHGLPPTGSAGRGRVRKYPWWPHFNVSTARDQARLAAHLVTLPETFLFTAIKTCDLVKTAAGYRVAVTRRTNEPNRVTQVGDGERIVKQLRNHNNVMRMDGQKILNADGKEAVDGLKTGYIEAGGSSLALTGTRKGRRAIVVVLGSSSSKERDAQAAHLLTDALGSLVW